MRESGFSAQPLDFGLVADYLLQGKVLAWVQGRCEIGPRALGNRSLLAAPFSAALRERLNAIKRREAFRPIAPICLASEFEAQFGGSGESPYMLYFQKVKSPESLAAVTHVDGSARAQTVAKSQNPEVYALLTAFKEKTGYGVLCNTSLNFLGRGFINRMSDLVRYSRAVGLDGFVVGDTLYSSASRIVQSRGGTP
jgi:hydroxymethyl cephem carbamoyltransferase